jgi:hypothetical protein
MACPLNPILRQEHPKPGRLSEDLASEVATNCTIILFRDCNTICAEWFLVPVSDPREILAVAT